MSSGNRAMGASLFSPTNKGPATALFRKIFFEATLCVTLSLSCGDASALSCQLSHGVFTSLPHPSRLWFSSIDTEGNRLLSRCVMNQLLPLTLYYYSPYISRLQMKRQAEKGDREGERSPEVSLQLSCWTSEEIPICHI